MNQILAIPLEVRLAVLFLFGTIAGSLVNLAVYRLAWNPRRISPWSRPEQGALPRRPGDRIPIAGWLGLRRETPLHGPGFWVRPMLLELLVGLGLAWLYWWEIERLALLPPMAARQAPMAVMHVQYCFHVALILLMLVASLIDADEKIIPDTITIPGTLLGLLAAAFYPWSLLPVKDLQNLQFPQFGPVIPHHFFLQVTSPFGIESWPTWMHGCPRIGSLLLALGCWWLWCVGLMARSWYTRHGYPRAIALSWARLRRDAATPRIAVMGLIGSIGIAAMWMLGGAGWEFPKNTGLLDLSALMLGWVGLLTALVGMAVGGMLIWTVRIIGANTLGREAMGFGDVTLLAMIGAFLGWQSCLIIFFLAPFFALGIGLLRLFLHSEREIPYGPFLCLAALTVLVRWPNVWHAMEPTFRLGPYIPLVVFVCMGLMALMLGAWRLILTAFEH